MSQKSTYTTFRCNDFIYDTIVVLHQSGDGDPQALLIFREPQRMAIHDKNSLPFMSFQKKP
jgi:hypothetical protein